MSMNNEKKVFLLGCVVNRTEEEEKELNELICQKLDWAWITGQLIRHRLNGNFITSLTKEQKGYIVGKVKATFGFLTECYSAVNMQNLSLIKEVFERTNAAGIKVAGLKGLVFNTSIYDISVRKSNDLDLLVAEKDLFVFEKIMKEMGFIQSFDRGITEASKKDKLIQRMNYHDLVPFYKRINLPFLDAIKIDVNFQFDSKEHEITEDIINYGLTTYSKNGYSVQGLKWETHLLHLCVHFFREASNSIWTSRARDVDLYKLVDIENTIRSYTVEQMSGWPEIVKKFQLEKQCYFTLYHLNKFYPKKLYEDLMSQIKINDQDFLNKIFIVGKNTTADRNSDFADQAFDMNYGMDFSVRDFSRIL